MRNPEFMNPIGALEPPGDLGRIIWGIFVLTAGVAPEPPGDSGRIAWGFLSAGVCVCTLVGVVSSFLFLTHHF